VQALASLFEVSSPDVVANAVQVRRSMEDEAATEAPKFDAFLNSDAVMTVEAFVQTRDWTPPRTIRRLLEDPTSRSALIAYVDALPREVGTRLIWEVGRVGGPHARAALEHWIEVLLADARTFHVVEPKWTCQLPMRLMIAATTLLELDADSVAAASAMVRIMSHPDPSWRGSAVVRAARVLRADLQTEAMLVLERALALQLDAEDPMVSLHAAPGLLAYYSWPPDPRLRHHRTQTVQRCRTLLDSDDNEVRSAAVGVLTKLGYKDVFFRWLAETPPLSSALAVLASYGGGWRWLETPLDPSTAILRRGLAAEQPRLRFAAVGGLARLRVVAMDVARELAEVAMADEPDPVLRAALERIASSPQ
jgi:hypothetical protein